MKKALFIVLGLVLVAGVGGFFYYYFFYQTPPEKWGLAEYSPAENYVVVEKEGVTRVVNEEAGISFEVPEGWKVEREGNKLVLSTPDMQAETPFYVKTGCRISIVTGQIKTDLETIKKELNRVVWSEGIESIETTKIDSYDAVKYNAKFEDIQMEKIGFYVLSRKVLGHKIYSLELDVSQQQKEQCANIFNNLISNVSIE